MDGSGGLVEIVEKKDGMLESWNLRVCGVVRGLINWIGWVLILALAKEVRK